MGWSRRVEPPWWRAKVWGRWLLRRRAVRGRGCWCAAGRCDGARTKRTPIGGFNEANRPNCLERAHPPPPPGPLGPEADRPPSGRPRLQTGNATTRRFLPASSGSAPPPKASSSARREESPQGPRARCEPLTLDSPTAPTSPDGTSKRRQVPPPPPPPATGKSTPHASLKSRGFPSFAAPTPWRSPISARRSPPPSGRPRCITPPASNARLSRPGLRGRAPTASRESLSSHPPAQATPREDPSLAAPPANAPERKSRPRDLPDALSGGRSARRGSEERSRRDIPPQRFPKCALERTFRPIDLRKHALGGIFCPTDFRKRPLVGTLCPTDFPNCPLGGTFCPGDFPKRPLERRFRFPKLPKALSRVHFATVTSPKPSREDIPRRRAFRRALESVFAGAPSEKSALESTSGFAQASAFASDSASGRGQSCKVRRLS